MRTEEDSEVQERIEVSPILYDEELKVIKIEFDKKTQGLIFERPVPKGKLRIYGVEIKSKKWDASYALRVEIIQGNISSSQLFKTVDEVRKNMSWRKYEH